MSDFSPEIKTSQRDRGEWKKETTRRKRFCCMPGDACFHGDVEACAHIYDDLTQAYPPLPRPPPAAGMRGSLFSPAAVTCRIHRRSFVLETWAILREIESTHEDAEPPIALPVFRHGSLGLWRKPALLQHLHRDSSPHSLPCLHVLIALYFICTCGSFYSGWSISLYMQHYMHN